MRALHVIPAVAPRYGGPSAAIGAMCRALRAADVETAIVTTDADGKGRLLVPLGVADGASGVPTFHFARRLGERYKWSPGLARWVDRHVEEFDVVHVHAVFSHSSVAAAGACRRSGVPYILRPLGSLDRWSLGQSRFAKRLFLGVLGDRMIRGAAALHCTSCAEADDASGIPGAPRTFVIPHGVECGKVAGAPAAPFPEVGSAPFVLSLSRLHPKKRLEILIDAFAMMDPAKGEPPWLVLAGDGDSAYLSALRGRAAGQRVLFPGWLSGERKAAALASATLLALVSSQENFGICAAEALACGVPVVVSPDVGIAPDIEAAGAGWVSDPDAANLAGVLRSVLGDPGGCRERGARGRTLAAERFSWSAVAAAIRKEYEKVLA